MLFVFPYKEVPDLERVKPNLCNVFFLFICCTKINISKSLKKKKYHIENLFLVAASDVKLIVKELDASFELLIVKHETMYCFELNIENHAFYLFVCTLPYYYKNITLFKIKHQRFRICTYAMLGSKLYFPLFLLKMIN